MEVPNIYVYVSPKIDGALSANDVSNSENLWPLRVIEHYLSGWSAPWQLSDAYLVWDPEARGDPGTEGQTGSRREVAGDDGATNEKSLAMLERD